MAPAGGNLSPPTGPVNANRSGPGNTRRSPRSGGRFPGTINIEGDTLTGLVRDVVADLARQGQRAIVRLSGHMERSAFSWEGADLALRDRIEGEAKLVLVN